MPYCNLQQLTDRYGEAMLVDLSDRGTPPAGAIVTAVIDRAIADADALIDGYLAGRYVLPLESVPSLVTDLSLRISIYKLHREVAADKIKQDHDLALSELKMIANGGIRLSVAGVEPAASGTSGVRTNDRQRPLTEDTMKGFI